ncbi:MAG: hypothetical protein ACYDAL_09965 [Candidatus Dormibacteraceae bacterium]
MGKGAVRWFSASILSLAIVAAGVGPAFAVGVAPAPGGPDAPTLAKGAQPLPLNDDLEGQLLALDNQITASRTAGDNPISNEQAGALREKAAHVAKQIKDAGPSGPPTFNGAWKAVGPNPIFQIQRSDGTPNSQSGRIGALAIRKDGTFILGAAQGGIWTMGPTDSTWTNRTDSLPSLATGALAVAPSNDLVVYDGTGEGALSGDSYYGNGILKSTDGGMTWTHVSGDFFLGVSISRLAIDPNDADHLYAAVLRGRGGARRVSPPIHSTFGIWESKDGGASWTLLKAAPAVSFGATDIRLDPQQPATLFASFWSDAIYKSTDGGATWNTIMNGLPSNADFAAGLTRFSIGLSHPAGMAKATLYTGFDWVDKAAAGGAYHPSRIFKSTDEGASWSVLPFGSGNDTVLDYCGTQCFYDNVIEPDPTNPDVVYVAGSFGYNMNPPSGGVFRSDNGGTTWKNLGWDMHPDFHALAFDPNNSSNVLVGNDGGVYFSSDKGGRLGANDPLNAADFWTGSLNGLGLQISQFTSIATNPSFPAGVAGGIPFGVGARIWGGTQDNGTLRKSAISQTWFDVTSGDGGQVVVDPTDYHYVYGTYFGIQLYRMTDGGAGFFTNQFIRNGINLHDRSEFYIPLVLNQLNPNQLFVGTDHLYRADNAKATSAGDVKWNLISPDLTSGCLGTAPNGARDCALSAIGVGGGTAVYTGSLDGLVQFSPDAQVNLNPTWTRVGIHGNAGNPHSLPNRPVAWIAVDRSDYRTAYVAFNGFNASTPKQPGHVFKTTNAGRSWQDISGNLPDNPVNSITLDPAYPNTLYAATDVGPFVTYNGGATWGALGTGIPSVAVDQIDLDTAHRVLAAGTHGRGAWTLTDTSAPAPALVLSKVDAGIPVGPASNLDYTLTLRNIGNGAASAVTITDPIPTNTKFVSADSGGTFHGRKVTWTGLAVPAGGQVVVHLRVQISPSLEPRITSIVNDDFQATDAEGQSVNGSPTVTPIAAPYAMSFSPAAQTGGAHSGQSQTYTVSIKNLGYKTDTYNLTSTGGTFSVSFYDATCTTAQTTTAAVIAGGTASVCVRVAVPATAPDGTTSTSTVIATSVGSPTVSGSGTITTIAVTVDTLLVDEDGNAPDVNSYYTTALASAGVSFDTWDLNANPALPLKYMEAFKHIVWFTGTSYPGPITPYENNLAAYLDNGGRLLMSGQDILDQAAGTTSFVHNYLHITWNGSEAQNDKQTATVTGVAGNPVTNGIGAVPIDITVLGGPGTAFMDEITPNGGAATAFKDDGTAAAGVPQPDALTFSGTYKLVFLAFAFEEYGSAAQKADLVTRVMAFFG